MAIETVISAAQWALGLGKDFSFFRLLGNCNWLIIMIIIIINVV